MPRPLLSASLFGLILAGCTAAPAPNFLVSADYLKGFNTELNPDAGPTLDSDRSGWSVTYETVPTSKNSNVAFSFLSREDDVPGKGNTSIDTDVFRTQTRWHYLLSQNIHWYVASGLGWAVSNDLNGRRFKGMDFNGGLYYDFELGVRWQPGKQKWGLEGAVNYSRLSLGSNNKRTVDSTLSGYIASFGVFIDF